MPNQGIDVELLIKLWTIGKIASTIGCWLGGLYAKLIRLFRTKKPIPKRAIGFH